MKLRNIAEADSTRRDFLKQAGSAVAAAQPGFGGTLAKIASKVASPAQFLSDDTMEDYISDMWYWGTRHPGVSSSMVRAWILKNENTPYWAASILGSHENFDALTGGAAGEVVRNHLGRLSTPDAVKTVWNALTTYADGSKSAAHQSVDSVETLGSSLQRCGDFGIRLDIPPKILAGVGTDPGASDYVLKMTGLDDSKRVELVRKIQRAATNQHEYRKNQEAAEKTRREIETDMARWADDGGFSEALSRRLSTILDEFLHKLPDDPADHKPDDHQYG